MVSHFPHTSRLLHLPSILPSIAAACFWLVVVYKILFGGHLRPRRIFTILFFVTFFAAPIQWQNALHIHSAAAACLSQCLLRRQNQLSVGCCVCWQNGGHLRPRPRPPLCFLMGCIATPQTKEPMTANESPTARGLGMVLGSGGDMI